MARALLIVDFQTDFTPGGALAVPGGDAIAERVNALLRDDAYALRIATRDWHPADHGSFSAQGGPWPPHCVAGTAGSQLHPALDRARVDVILDKGQDPASDGYSAFQDTGLERMLRERGIDTLTVCGLATDYCVKHTALDALRAGFAVEVDMSAVRGVELTPGDSGRALDELRAAGARIGEGDRRG